MSSPLNIWIGHDGREHDGTIACEHSLWVHASQPLQVKRLVEPALRHSGIYRREWLVEGSQKFDARDKKPFSTLFSFTRFLVPTLMLHDGWALFCDSDFLFRADVAEIFKLADQKYAVQVVKHGVLPHFGRKMDEQRQEPYFRKNWSSLILWNCSHPANQRLIPHTVNLMSGQWLHAFSWLDDQEIGELPHEWNFLVGIDDPAGIDPKAVHFTRGIPSMAGYDKQPFADEWWKVLAEGKQR